MKVNLLSAANRENDWIDNVAHLVEHSTSDRDVTGSTPVVGSISHR